MSANDFVTRPRSRTRRVLGGALPPRFFVEDAAPDMVKLINLALDQLTRLHPPFKPRLKLEADKEE